MIKKPITGIIIAALALWAIYLYFLYAGNPWTLRNWIQTHSLYTTIFIVSIITTYMLQWSNRIFNFLIFIIILVNIFIVWDTFFRNNIGLNSAQFMTLFGLILGALAITYITHRVRYIFMSIVGIGIVFVLLTGMLPLYNNIPSISDFIWSQNAKIINQWWASEWLIIIKNALGTKEVPVSEISKKDIDLSQKTQISFSSKTQWALEKIFIGIWNGVFINIPPQSSVTLQQTWDNTIMQILQWNIQYYTPPELAWAIKIIGKYKGKSVQDIQNNIRWNLLGQFEQKKQEFFINQLGGNMVLNPTIDKIIKFFINTLYNISPKTYQKNLTNYNNIQQYLGKATTGIITQKTGPGLESIINDIMSQVKKWAGETKINQWLQ